MRGTFERRWTGALGALGVFLLVSAMGADASAQVSRGGNGSRQVGLQFGVQQIVNNDAGQAGPVFTARAGYAIDVLVLEGQAGFQNLGFDDGRGGRINLYGPFLAVGGRIRIPAGDYVAPYFSGAMRMSWWNNVPGFDGMRFSPAMVAQLGAEIFFSRTSRFPIHVGLESQLHFAGRDAFPDRQWSLGPYVGIGMIY